MLLYMSAGTSYEIYNKQFNKELITAGYQAQKFNYNIIQGLLDKTDLVSLSALPYINKRVRRIEKDNGNIKYICIENHPGKLHKIYNLTLLIREGKKIIKKKRPEFIVCDAISLSHAIAALYLSHKYNIPSIAIITDIPEVMCYGKMTFFMRLDAWFMKRFSAYILLTAQMNKIVNLRHKPYMVMEGTCSANVPIPERIENGFSVCIYSGSLWKKTAGLEYFIEGFIMADIPNCELHFYGTGELTDIIIDISKQHPQVKYMGCITSEELTKRQSRAALLVNPRPSSECFCKYSFPSKTFEYMASGVPVFMTKLPGIPDEYFNYVYTIDHENAQGVCDNLRNIFSQSKESLFNKGLSAREYIIKNKNNIVQSQRILMFLKSLQ